MVVVCSFVFHWFWMVDNSFRSWSIDLFSHMIFQLYLYSQYFNFSNCYQPFRVVELLRSTDQQELGWAVKYSFQNSYWNYKNFQCLEASTILCSIFINFAKFIQKHPFHSTNSFHFVMNFSKNDMIQLRRKDWRRVLFWSKRKWFDHCSFELIHFWFLFFLFHSVSFHFFFMKSIIKKSNRKNKWIKTESIEI